MSKREIEQFESQLPDHEKLDRGKHLMTKARRESLIFPLGSIVVDKDDGIIWEGDGKTMGGVSTTDSLNRIFPDNSGEYKYSIRVDPVSEKLAVYEQTAEGEFILRNVFGSMKTNKYITTEAMGGLQHAHKDGYNYHLARVSPTGEGNSAVFGNYASDTFLASSGRVLLSYENGNLREDKYNDEVTSIVESKDFSVWIKMDRPGLAYSVKAHLEEPLEEPLKIISYMATRKHSDNDMLHETIPIFEWNLVNDVHWLEMHGAEYVTIPAGVTEFTLPGSHPMPFAPHLEHGLIDGKMCWAFKQPIRLVGIDKDNLKYTQCWEEAEIEQVASRAWVTDSAAGQTYREIDSDSTPEELIVSKGENLIVKELSGGSITVSPAVGVRSFTVRDKGDFLSDTKSVVAQLTPDSSVTMVRGGDNVLFNILADGTCSYYNYRTGLGGAV